MYLQQKKLYSKASRKLGRNNVGRDSDMVADINQFSDTTYWLTFLSKFPELQNKNTNNLRELLGEFNDTLY